MDHLKYSDRLAQMHFQYCLQIIIKYFIFSTYKFKLTKLTLRIEDHDYDLKI